MKIRLIQSDPFAGKLQANFEQISEHLSDSNLDSEDIMFFPANSLEGAYLYKDIISGWYQTEVRQYLKKILTHPSRNAFILGAILPTDGIGLQNTLIFISENKIKACITKRNLSFEEQKYCRKGDGVQLVTHNNKNWAIGFYDDFEDFLKKENSGHIDHVVCFGSEFFTGKESLDQRNLFLREISIRLSAYTIFINRAGSAIPFLYTGGSSVLNRNGSLCCQSLLFQNSYDTIDLDNLSVQEPEVYPSIALSYTALTMGIQSYFRKNKFKKAVLGLSGGIDSALVATLAVAALGNENVTGILMPSDFSSEHSITDAVELAENLKIKYEVVPIKPLFALLNETLSPVFKDVSFGLTEENMQARLRGIILMSVSNKTGALLLNTSNKSEVAVGYGTLYGDMCGSLAILGDLYKTDVFEMSRWINRCGIIIPQNTIEKAPSAELRPNQKDSDSLPEYSILDKILHAFIEEEKSCEDICQIYGFDPEMVNKTIKLVKANEYKRRQAAPILKLSPTTFGLEMRFSLE